MVIVVPIITWWLFIPWFKTTNRKFLIKGSFGMCFHQRKSGLHPGNSGFHQGLSPWMPFVEARGMTHRRFGMCFLHDGVLKMIFWVDGVTKKRTKKTQSSTRATQNSKATWVTQDGLCPGAMIMDFLVGGWTNPFEKYDRQIGSSPQVGMKIKNIWAATT